MVALAVDSNGNRGRFPYIRSEWPDRAKEYVGYRPPERMHRERERLQRLFGHHNLILFVKSSKVGRRAAAKPGCADGEERSNRARPNAKLSTMESKKKMRRPFLSLMSTTLMSLSTHLARVLAGRRIRSSASFCRLGPVILTQLLNIQDSAPRSIM